MQYPMFFLVVLILSQFLKPLVATSCTSSPNGLTYGTDWGPFQSSSSYSIITCLSITNDKSYSRSEEVAYSGIPISQSSNIINQNHLNRLVLVGANNRRIPCQFEVLSRWTGPITDTSLPIRWLQVIIPVTLNGDSTATFELRQYSTAQTNYSNQSNDLSITSSSNGNTHVISTGAADFTIDETLGSLIRQIELNDEIILTTDSNTSSGVSLTFIPQQTNVYGSSPRTITSNDNAASVDYFEITENGPVKAVAMIEGTLSDSSGASLCDIFGSYYANPYESFTYSLSLSFFRSRSDFKVQFHIRNQCSNGDGTDWTDQSCLVNQASYQLDFSEGIDETVFSSHYYGGSDTSSKPNGKSSGSSVEMIVEQRKGGGSGNSWSRRARVLSDGATLQSAQYYDAPFLALSDGTYVVGTTLSYMKYREPQALRLEGSVISIDVISEQQRIGEGKGIWNHAMIVLRVVGSNNVRNLIQSLRWQALLEVERGLLVRTPAQYYTSTGTMPPLGNDNAGSTVIKSSYLDMMERMHSDTMNTQWSSAKTYGSQLWPDIQFDGYSINNSNPSQNDPHHGYWNPHAHELVEFFRAGDPKYVHDLALPLSWLMTYTAYLNVGRETHDYVRSGLCINSSGSGDGQWHRSGFGSDDYMYNLAIKHAYVLRPDPIFRRRIEITGRTLVGRYDRTVPEQNRDIYIERLDVARGVLQHMEAGMNCAEFGISNGGTCDTWFKAVMSEFIDDNLSTGAICQPDEVSGRNCPSAQTFMIVSMMYEFFMRVYLNYGDLDGGLRKAVEGIPKNLYNFAVDKKNGGNGISYLGNHAYLLSCTTNAARTSLNSCTYDNAGDGLNLFEHNINSLMATLLMGHFFDSSLEFCSKVEAVWTSQPTITNTWETVVVGNAGWIKGTSQMMSLMGYGVGMFDNCVGTTFPPKPATPAPTTSPIRTPVTPAPTTSPTRTTPAPVDLKTPAPTSSPTRTTPAPVDPKTPAPATPAPIVTLTSSPAGGTSCEDSPFRFRLVKNGKRISRDCNWVEKRDTRNRCGLEGVSSMCAKTCNSCSTCVDGSARFRFSWNGRMIARDCSWVSNKQTLQRCAVAGMNDTCRVTCDSCKVVYPEMKSLRSNGSPENG